MSGTGRPLMRTLGAAPRSGLHLPCPGTPVSGLICTEFANLLSSKLEPTATIRREVPHVWPKKRCLARHKERLTAFALEWTLGVRPIKGSVTKKTKFQVRPNDCSR